VSSWKSVYCPILLLLAIALLTRGDNAVERHLAHDQENDQSHGGPYYALLEGDLGLGDLDLGNERGEWLDQVEETDCMRMLSAFALDSAFNRAIGVLCLVGGAACHDTYGRS
jgi:hypothetical protein